MYGITSYVDIYPLACDGPEFQIEEEEMRRAARIIPVITCLVCLVTLTAKRLEAQAGGSVLALLEPKGALSVGGEVEGALSNSDYRSSRDTYLEAWSLDGRAGEQVTIDLISDDFDAFLLVTGPGFDETLSDDDGGGACHARLSFRFLEDGTFHVIATSNGPRETGVYALRLSREPGPVARYECGGVNPDILTALPVDDRRLRLGDVALGSLDAGDSRIMEGRIAEAWALEGAAGESVAIRLEADEFDALLLVVGPGIDGMLSDDDGGGNYNSLLTIKFPESGTYTVVATTVGEGIVGPYTIGVEEPLDLNTLPTDGRIVEVGGTMTGTLTASDPMIGEGRYGQAWAFPGSGGQSYTIELDSSDFDCYLMVVGPGIAEPFVDDDSGGDLNARLGLTLPEDGDYRVIVTSAGPEETGAFTLRVVGN